MSHATNSVLHLIASNAGRKVFHPFCEVCGWRKGGADSWDGRSCKCKHSEPPIRCVDPKVCLHCEYDRKFPPLQNGGWLQQENNGPIVPCPVCNPDSSHPRE